MMHSCCCICFIEWCGFGFICFGFKNLFKWFGKQIHIKKREEELTYAAGGLENRPDRPASLSREWAELSRAFLFSSARVGRPSRRCARLFLPHLADGWGPLDSALFYLAS
jgi:hypothetical protein